MAMRFKVGDMVYRELHDDRLQEVKIHKVLENTNRYKIEFEFNDGLETRKLVRFKKEHELYLSKQEFYTKRIAQYNHERDVLLQKLEKLMKLKLGIGD